MYGISIAVAPPPRLTVDQHAESTLFLSERTSAIPGIINLDRTPYLRHPLREFTNPKISFVSMMTGTQIGKTVFLFAIINYIVDHAPGPLMILYPSLDIARDVSKDRLQPFFRDCPNLKQHMTGVEDDFQLLKYKLDRMAIRFAWNSPTSVSSHPIKYLLKDETARVDPLVLKEANDRTKTFPGRKILEASSPKYPNDNICTALGLARDWDLEEKVKVDTADLGEGCVRMPIRRWLQKGSNTVYQYYVPCPHCNGMQQLYPDRIIWPRDCAIRDLKFAASYMCDLCGGEIKDHMKIKMVLSGEWRTDNPGSSAIGYQLSSLYSLLGDACTFGEIAAQWLRAHTSKRPEEMEAFVNGYLAWPYEDEEFALETIELSEVIERRQGYRSNTLPEDVKLLTAAVDVHRRSLYFSVWGWGGPEKYDRDGYLITWGIIEVDMDHDVAGALQYIRERVKGLMFSFVGSDKKLGVLGVAIDSAYKTSEVYDWARQCKWLKPVRGARGEVEIPEGMAKFITSENRIDKTPDGKLIDGGIILRVLNTGLLKREVYTGINSGSLHFPDDIEQDFLNQVNSEKAVTRIAPRTGKIKRFYVKKKRSDLGPGETAANHYLDTVVYNRAIIEVIGAGMTLEQAANKYYPKPRERRAVSYEQV